MKKDPIRIESVFRRLEQAQIKVRNLETQAHALAAELVELERELSAAHDEIERTED